MLPNLDLILLTILHASFICCVLLVVIFIILLALLVALSLAISSIILLDLHDFSSILSELFKMVMDDLELGMALILVSLIDQAVGFVLGSKHRHKHKNDEFELKARYSTRPIHVLKTVR